jgi:hypothetical protein
MLTRLLPFFRKAKKLTFLHVDPPGFSAINKGFCKSFAPQKLMEHGAKTYSNGTTKTGSATAKGWYPYPGDCPESGHQPKQCSQISFAAKGMRRAHR